MCYDVQIPHPNPAPQSPLSSLYTRNLNYSTIAPPFASTLAHFPSSNVQGFLSAGGGNHRQSLRRWYPAAQPAKKIKLLLLGDSGVGKSSLVERFTEDHFNPSTVRLCVSHFVSLRFAFRVLRSRMILVRFVFLSFFRSFCFVHQRPCIVCHCAPVGQARRWR